MSYLIRLSILSVFLIAAIPSSNSEILGVPLSCCGKLDCIPAQVRFLGWENGKVMVRVNGVILQLHPARYSTSKFGMSYYCSLCSKLEELPSQKCARCVIEAIGVVRKPPINPLAVIQKLPSGQFFVAEKGCRRCHDGRSQK